jgi:hypothetical protein
MAYRLVVSYLLADKTFHSLGHRLQEGLDGFLLALHNHVNVALRQISHVTHHRKTAGKRFRSLAKADTLDVAGKAHLFAHQHSGIVGTPTPLVQRQEFSGWPVLLFVRQEEPCGSMR